MTGTYEYWYNRVCATVTLDEMDTVMFEASEDRTLTGAEYARLCFVCRERLGDEAEGSIY